MARLGEIEYRGDGSDPRQLLNYMLQLEEQIKYALAHLGSENIQAGAIDEKLLAPAVKQNIQNIEIRVEGQERKSRELKSEDGKLRTLILETEEGIMRDMEDVEAGLRTTIMETAAGINTSINDKLGNYYTKSETATEINTRMGNALGDYYTKTETAQKIQTDMGDALGNYYTKTETAQQISTTLSNALGNYYTKSETATEINTRMGNVLGDYYTKTETANYVGTYVGNAAYGKVSGISITQQGIDMTGSEHINLGSGGLITIGTGFVAGISRTQIRALDVYSTRMSGYVDMTSILEDLDWYGWIRDASVSGNTLTLTKSSGNTVTFTPSGGGSYTLPTALQELADVLESVSYANGRLVLYMTGNNTITLYNGTHNAD